MDIITINLNDLKKLKLNINEYLTLYTIYLRDKQGTKIPFDIEDYRYKAELAVKKLLIYDVTKKNYKLSRSLNSFKNDFINSRSADLKL